MNINRNLYILFSPESNNMNVKRLCIALVLLVPLVFSWDWYVRNQTVEVNYGDIAKYELVLESRTWIKLPIKIEGDIGVIYPEYVTVVGKKNVTLLVPTKNLLPGEYEFRVSVNNSSKKLYLKVKSKEDAIDVFSVYAKLTGVPGETVSVPLVITNNANITLKNLQVTAELSGRLYTSTLFDIPARSTKDISVSVKVPEDLTPGTYNIKIVVISPYIKKGLSVPIEVRSKTFLKNIHANLSSVNVKNGTYFLTLVVTNDNSVAVRELKLDVVFGNGSIRQLLSLLPFETKEFTIKVESPEEDIRVIISYDNTKLFEKTVKVEKAEAKTGITGLFVLTQGEIHILLIALAMVLVALIFYSYGRSRAGSQRTSLDYIKHYIEEAKENQGKE